VAVPAEDDHTHLQNGIMFQRDEAEADDQKGSAPTQYTSRPISLTKRDRLKDKLNNESPAIQRVRQLKGVTPPHLSLTGRRHVKEISYHSNLQLTGKHHLNTFPAPVSTTQQASLETDTTFLEDVAPSDEYTTPFDDDVDIPPELDSTELKRRSVPSEEPLAANSFKENTTPNDAASIPGNANLPRTPSGAIPLTASKQIAQPQDELPTPHKPAHHHRAHRNSAVPLDVPTPPKRNSAVPQDRPSTSAGKKRDLKPAQQVLAPPTSQQPPLTKQHRRQNHEGASWTVAHPPPKET
jgi:hypothetical protein